MKNLSNFLTENVAIDTVDITINEGLGSLFKKLWNWAKKPFTIDGKYEIALKKRYKQLLKQRKAIRKQLNGLAEGSIVAILYEDGTSRIEKFVKGSRGALNAAKAKIMFFMVGNAVSTIKDEDFACNPVSGHEKDGMGFLQFLNFENNGHGNEQLIKCEITPILYNKNKQKLKITKDNIPSLSGNEKDYYPQIQASDVVAVITGDKDKRFIKMMTRALINYAANLTIQGGEGEATVDKLFENDTYEMGKFTNNGKENYTKVFVRLFKLLGYDDIKEVKELIKKEVERLNDNKGK